MFVRKKKNKSGSTSVQVIDKSSGRYKVVKSLGSSSQPHRISELVTQARQWISRHGGQNQFDFDDEAQVFSSFVDGIQQLRVVGTELLLGKIFDQIGFDHIDDELFKKLVLARLSFPASKRKTAELLYHYHGLDIDEDSLYRYMDKLYTSQKQTVQQISYQHTLAVVGGQIRLVFYDVTTLYFEIDTEDELRKTGFSKEGKHQNPQIVLAVLVSVDGYPLAYEVFEGNKFEGHTMLPVIDRFKATYNLTQLVIVADSGLLSQTNITELQDKGYEFILGARIKSESRPIKDQILQLDLSPGEHAIIRKDDTNRLIISYSSQRAKKDQANREKGLARLEKKLKSGKLTKAHINNKGYNKYLRLHGDVDISIDRDKFEADRRWDGLKGYLTNSKLPSEQIIENYQHLWRIEQAFRISKTELKVRPVYHRLQRRIEAHICIAFVAYKVYKELERQLKVNQASISAAKAIEIAKTIYAITVKTPTTNQTLEQTLILNEQQRYLVNLFEL